jgi:hypothetical protein
VVSWAVRAAVVMALRSASWGSEIVGSPALSLADRVQQQGGSRWDVRVAGPGLFPFEGTVIDGVTRSGVGFDQ